MSTDRELLELAAKAAGIKVTWSELAECHFINDGLTPWNPLTDDGDALRLAARLKIGLHWCISGRVYAHTHGGVETCESSREDLEANLRRAIVRTAAAIGESMP